MVKKNLMTCLLCVFEKRKKPKLAGNQIQPIKKKQEMSYK